MSWEEHSIISEVFLQKLSKLEDKPKLRGFLQSNYLVLFVIVKVKKEDSAKEQFQAEDLLQMQEFRFSKCHQVGLHYWDSPFLLR